MSSLFNRIVTDAESRGADGTYEMDNIPRR